MEYFQVKATAVSVRLRIYLYVLNIPTPPLQVIQELSLTIIRFPLAFHSAMFKQKIRSQIFAEKKCFYVFHNNNQPHHSQPYGCNNGLFQASKGLGHSWINTTFAHDRRCFVNYPFFLLFLNLWRFFWSLVLRTIQPLLETTLLH